MLLGTLNRSLISNLAKMLLSLIRETRLSKSAGDRFLRRLSLMKKIHTGYSSLKKIINVNLLELHH